MTIRCRTQSARWLASLLLTVLCACGAWRTDPLPYADEFDNPDSGWGAERTGAFERGYQDSGYFIALRRPDWLIWATPGHTFADVSVEADVNAGAGAAVGLAGVLCRHRNRDNFYLFAITSDGYYGIFRRVDGGALEALTGEGALLFSDAIVTGDAVNHVQAVCQGEELSLFVNERPLATVTDTAHTRGDVGLGAASGPTGQARAEFDNLEVTSPD
jgi:hypothetical protein